MAPSTAAANPAGARLVPCETADKQLIPVEVDVVRVSRTFATMYDVLGIEECTAFPGVFPVTIIESRVFIRVIDWCREHKGQPDPIVEKYTLTQVEKWFEFSDFEERFLSLPVPDLLELIEAADFLDIRSLYEYGCQAIAALIKWKRPVQVRQVLQQAGDLSAEDIQAVFARNLWLGSRYKLRQATDPNTMRRDPFHAVDFWSGTRHEYRDQFVYIPEPIDIPPNVLVTIFHKLTRADLEWFQLVSHYFSDVIVKLPEKRGPLCPLDVTLGTGFQAKHVVTAVGDNSRDICLDRDGLGKHLLLKHCTVRRLEFSWDGEYEISHDLLVSLSPLKHKWNNATVIVSMYRFTSKASFEYAFTELFMCKELHVEGQALFDPQPFMLLPSVLQCSKLKIAKLDHLVAVNDVVEWLEREKPEHWDEPMYLEVNSDRVNGGFASLMDALKNAFLKAARPNSYTVRIMFEEHLPQYDEQHRNKKTKEQMTIKSSKRDAWDWYIAMERKPLN